MAFAMLDAPRAARALLTASAVRERSAKMLGLGVAGELSAFTVDMDRLPATADLVVEVIRANYPDLAIPSMPAGGISAPARTTSARTSSPASPIRRSAAAPPSTSPSSPCCSMPAQGWRGATATPRPAWSSPNRKASRSPPCACSRPAPFADDGVSARPTRRGLPPSRPRHRPRLPGLRHQPAGGPRGPRQPPCPPRHHGEREPAGLRDARHAPPRRPLRPSGSPGRRWPPACATAILGAVLTHLGPIWPSRVTLGAWPSAIAGTIRRSAPAMPATGSSPSTSCRNGSPIRSSSRSRAPADGDPC